MAENIIAKSLNAGQSPQLALQNTNVVRQSSTNYSTMATDAIRGALRDVYAERARKRAEEKRVDVVNQQLKGQLTATAGSNLPPDAGKFAQQAFDSTSFMLKTRPMFDEMAASFDDENFAKLPQEERNEIGQEFVQDMLLQVEQEGLGDNPAVLEYLNTQTNNMFADMDAAVTNYTQEILPARTMSNMFEIQRESVEDPSGNSPEDIKAWKTILDGADATADGQGMSAETKNKHLYAETARMLDSGDLSVFNAAREHPVWERFTTNQKRVLEKSARSVQAAQRKQILDSTADNFKRIGAQAVATGDLTTLNETMAEINKLPPSELQVIMPSIRKTYNDVQDTIETIEKGDARMSGYTNIEMDQKQVDKYAKYKIRESMLRSGEDTTTQQAAQKAAVDMAKNGLSSPELSRYFSLENPVFQEGRLDVMTTTSIQGAESLKSQGLPVRVVEDIMGKDSYELFQIYQGFREKNLDMTAAMAAALEQKQHALEAPEEEKFEEYIDYVSSRGIGGSLWDAGEEVLTNIPIVSQVGSGLINFLQDTGTVGKAAIIGVSEAETGGVVDNVATAMQGVRQRRQFRDVVNDKDRDEIGFEDPGMFARAFGNAAKNANASHNRLELAKLRQDTAERRAMWTNEQKQAHDKQYIQESALNVNGSLLLDREVVKEMTEFAGSRDAANQYTTEAVQVFSMLSAASPADRDEIVSSLYDHYVDGDLVDPNTPEGMRILANTPEEDIKSNMSYERLQTYVNDGFELNGKSYQPLRFAIGDVADGPVSQFTFNAPVTRARYLKEMDGFAIEVMDMRGEPVVTGRDLFYTQREVEELGTGRVTMQDVPALSKGSNLTINMPRSFMRDYIKAAQTSTFNN